MEQKRHQRRLYSRFSNISSYLPNVQPVFHNKHRDTISEQLQCARSTAGLSLPSCLQHLARKTPPAAPCEEPPGPEGR